MFLITILFMVALWAVFAMNVRRIGKLFAAARKGALPFFTEFYQVNHDLKINGGDLVAKVLYDHGIKEVFTLVGGHISPILVGAEKLGLRVIDTRHEATAVFAADAVARLRQHIGVAIVTAGPGVTNTITAMKNAQMAESPVLLIGGAAPTMLQGRGALQDINQMTLFTPLCKYVRRISKLTNIADVLHEAIHVAQSGTPGPVFVELPIDVLYPIETVFQQARILPNPKGVKQILLNFYLSNHYCRMFSGITDTIPTIIPKQPDITFANDDSIASIVDLIRGASHPVLLVGSQAMLPPTNPQTLAEAVGSLGMPVFLGGMARGLLPDSNSNLFRHSRRAALKDADLIILAGSVCDFRLDYGRVFPKNAKVVAINRDSHNLNLNLRIFWRGTLLIQADAGNALVRIEKELHSQKSTRNWQPWLDQLTELQVKEKASIAQKSQATVGSNAKCINPINIIQRIDAHIPDNAVIVVDGGDFVATASYVLRSRGPLRWLDPGAFGTLGVGGGFALGAKAVYPDSPVCIYYGDGSSGYSIVEYDTFVRHKMPVMSFIGNDACWQQIFRDQIKWFKSDVACMLRYSSYEKVADVFGCRGYQVDSSNVDEIIDSKLDTAVADAVSKESSIFNILVAKTDFRDGSISV